MKTIQILIIIGFILYILFNSINFMDNHSKESGENFRQERNWKIGLSIIAFILLYLAGCFSQIF